MHKTHSFTRLLVTIAQKFNNKVQGWRTHQAGRLTHKTHAYKWIISNEDGIYKSNHTNKPIGWGYQLFNQSENDLNTHLGINTVKKEMMAEHITTKELISWTSKMRRVRALSDYKSLKLNLYYKINLGVYSLLWKWQVLKPWPIFTKILRSDSFFRLGFQTLDNYLSYYDRDLVHYVNIK